jgi:hypothetical protein
MAGPTVRARLWADAPRTRFWLIPDDATLPTGTLRIEAVGGKHQLVDAAALERYSIPREEASRRAREEVDTHMKAMTARFSPLIRAGKALLENMGVAVPAGPENPLWTPERSAHAEELFMSPLGARTMLDREYTERGEEFLPYDPETDRKATEMANGAMKVFDTEPGKQALEAIAGELARIAAEQRVKDGKP